MAEDDYDDDYDFYDDGDNYIWVEDGYDLADDLAELVVPDPPFGSYEVDWDDLTRYEFWYDIEYDSDGYHDQKIRHRKRTSKPREATSPKGKKRRAVDDSDVPSKRVKRSEVTQEPAQLPSVLFVPKKTLQNEREVDPSKLDAYAILPNWRERFKDVRALPALRTTDELESNDVTQSDDRIEEMEDAGPDTSAELEGLRLALEANLSSLGLDATKVDQSLLLRLVESMMAQSDEAEEIMAELIEGIHAEKEGETEGDSFSEWVASSATKSANEKHENEQNRQVDELDDGIAQARRPALVDSTPSSTNTPGSRGRKRKADSPSNSKPTDRKKVADKLST